MIRLFINGLAASAGGGLTYLRNVIPELARRSDVETTVLLNPGLRAEFADFDNICFVEPDTSSSTLRRFIREQTGLSALILRSGAQVLLSAGNFALWNSPVPQILLSRNSLYTSADFLRDVRARGDYAIWADTLIKAWFARQSIRHAHITVAPSQAFARDLEAWTGRQIAAIHHGFNPEAFAGGSTPLLPAVQAALDDGRDAIRLLFVSHYNYYRNFETLFRAIPLLKAALPDRQVKLYLTCRLDSGKNPGSYRADAASALVRDLYAGGNIVELGTIPYGSLHHLYRACHIYITPAYAESFAHPLVEAMSSGLPVVASDLPVHREICRDAALYFPRFSPEALAKCVQQLRDEPASASRLAQTGTLRAKDFSWLKHVSALLELAAEVTARKR